MKEGDVSRDCHGVKSLISVVVDRQIDYRYVELGLKIFQDVEEEREEEEEEEGDLMLEWPCHV